MDRSISDIQPRQLVQHYKGGLYRVTGFTQLEASNQAAVTYCSLDRTKKPVYWVREVGNFLEKAGDADRFSLIPVETAAGLERALPEYLMSKEAVESVLAHYDAPHRYYHDRSHIYAMFNLAAEERIVLTNEQCLAILFHDIVFVPGAPAGFNENASAQMVDLFRDQIKLSNVNFDTVKAIIRDTAAHQPTCGESGVVLDLDLAGLAGTASQFALAWELNRLECAHLVAAADNPGLEFDKARLRHFLTMCQQPRIFHSATFSKDSFEDGFRNNVETSRQRFAQASAH